MAIRKSDNTLLEEISAKLDIIVGMLVVGRLDDPASAVERLSDMGLGNKTIAQVVGLSENAVAIRLSRLRSKKKKKKAKATTAGDAPS